MPKLDDADTEKTSTCTRYSGLATFIFLYATVFVAHFLYSRGFGLYADDYTHVLPYIFSDKATSEVFKLVKASLLNIAIGDLGFRGRPIAYLLFALFGVVGSHLAGFWGLFLIGSLIAAINAFLLYLVLSTRLAQRAALIGALVFALFPAFTLHQWLTADYQHFMASIFLLLATLALIRGRPILPYFLITCCLLIYEPYFFPFLAIPLLIKKDWNRAFIKRLLLHSIILCAILGASIALRIHGGEARMVAATSQLADVPLRLLKTIAYGSFASAFYSIPNAVSNVLKWLDLTIAVAVILSSAIFYYMLSAMRRDTVHKSACILKTLFTGFILVLSSYVTAFWEGYVFLTKPDLALFGYESRFHAVAGIGLAVIVASVYSFASGAAASGNRMKVANLFFAAMMAFLVGYGHLIQYDFIKANELQRGFFTTVLNAAPDIDDGTLIFIREEDLPRMPDFLTLSYIYDFPKSWNRPPRGDYRTYSWVNDTVRINGERIEILIATDRQLGVAKMTWEEVQDNQIIFFDNVGGKLQRIDGTVRYKDRLLKLKPKPAPGASFQEFPKGVLYDRMIDKNARFELVPLNEVARLSASQQPAKWSSFNGNGSLSPDMPELSKTESLTIEMWLKPEGTDFPIADFSADYPPMAALVGPLKIAQLSKNKMIASFGGADSYLFSIKHNEDGEYEWLHLEAAVAKNDTDGNSTAMLFVNGRKVREEKAIATFDGPFSLGGGPDNRFWKGKIGGLRISNVVRHTQDFVPIEAATDRNTIHMLP